MPCSRRGKLRFIEHQGLTQGHAVTEAEPGLSAPKPRVWPRSGEAHAARGARRARPGREQDDWRSWTPHPFLLLPPTQMSRSGSRPRALHAHPRRPAPAAPCLPAATHALQEGSKGKRREEEEGRAQRSRKRETMGETTGALDLGDLKGSRGPPATQAGQSTYPHSKMRTCLWKCVGWILITTSRVPPNNT